MTNLADTELLRARWRRALGRHALDEVGRDDFATGGLAKRLRSSTVQILLLPKDPDAEPLQLDSELWAWLETVRAVDLDGGVVRLGEHRQATAHAAVLVGSYPGEPWRSYMAVHRSGAIEFALGALGAWERRTQEGERVRVFNLISIVAHTWALLKVGGILHTRLAMTGPSLLSIALRDTREALLGNLGEGWAEPGSFDNSVGGCVEEHLLWHITIDEPLDDESSRRIAFELGDRMENAWGTTHRRYLDGRGDRAGNLDPRRVRD